MKMGLVVKVALHSVITTSIYLLVVEVGYSSAQIDVQSLKAAEGNYSSVEERQKNISCVYTPGDATYITIRWYHKNISSSGIKELVYQYTHTSGGAEGRFAGRAIHFHDTGKITLEIQNIDWFGDRGTFYCSFRGAQTLEAETTFSVSTDPEKRESTRVPASNTQIPYDASLTASVSYSCNDPPVEFTWIKDGVEKSTITTKSSDGCISPLAKSESSYTENSAKKTFTIVLRKHHISYENGTIDEKPVTVVVGSIAANTSHNISASLRKGSIPYQSGFRASVWYDCNDPAVEFIWVKDGENQPSSTIKTSCSAPRQRWERSMSVYTLNSVTKTFTIALVQRHHSFEPDGMAVMGPFTITVKCTLTVPEMKGGIASGCIVTAIAIGLLIFCGYRVKTGHAPPVPVIAVGVILIIIGVILIIVFAVLQTC